MGSPTVTPVTGIPIDYDESYANAGVYHPEGFIHKIASSILPSVFPPGGSITVNPKNTADVNKVITHESVHGLLNGLDASGQLQQLNSQNPYYSKIASAITDSQGGDPSTEAPAYAATGETSQLKGVNPIISQQYRDTLLKQLLKLDPNIGKMYQQLMK